MRRSWSVWIRVLAGIALAVCAGATAGTAQNFKGTANAQLAVPPPLAQLGAGEELQYFVEWLGVPVGSIVLKQHGVVKVRGFDCYHISAQSRPNRFLRKIVDLEYRVHSYLDTRTLESRRFIKTRRINKQFNLVYIEFFPEQKRAVWRSWGRSEVVKFSKRRESMEVEPTQRIPRGTQDLLSSFYYFRLQPCAQGTKLPVNIYYNRANWPVDMLVERVFLKDFTRRGSVEAIEVAITSRLNDYILGKRKISFCVTADERRIPVSFRIGTSIGSITGVIQELPR